MLKVISIACKDMQVHFANRSAWLFFLILPMVFVFIIGGGFAPAEQKDDRRIRIVAVNESTSTLATDVLANLSQSSIVRVDALSRDAAQREFDAEHAAGLLILPADMTDAAPDVRPQIRLAERRNDPNAALVGAVVQQAVIAASRAMVAARGATDEAQRLRSFVNAAGRERFYRYSLARARAMQAAAPVRLEAIKSVRAVKSGYSAATQASLGQMITWVLIPMLGISALFPYERRNGTLSRMLTSPTSRGTMLLGTIAGQFAMALVQMTLLVGFGVVVMKVNYGHSLPALALMMVAFGLAGTALGTMLGTFTKSDRQASSLSIMLGMAMGLLGGCWYPLELFPEAVRNVVHMLPTTWAMRGFTDIISRGQGVDGVLLEVAVLLAFALLFYGVGVLRFVNEVRPSRLLA